MAVHLTPLKRTQLLDLVRLIEFAQKSPSCSFLGSSNSDSNCTVVGSEHPFLSGTFCDVFENPLTRDSWRLYDKMLYLVWWSHRPPSCNECGMRDAWAPSAENEMKCWHCGAAAGTTSGNDIVEDIPITENEDGEEDDCECMGHESGGNATDGGGGSVAFYMFFYDWLSRLHLTERGKGVVLPRGESLPAVLRAAYDLALLFVTPRLPSGGANVVQGGALYLSLVLHRFPVPFPLFSLAGRVNTASDSQVAGNASVASAANNHCDNTGTTQSNDSAVAARCELAEELQWVDVELLAALIGVSLSDFFESSQVAVQYLQNVMTVAAAFAVPSVLWHPQRLEGRTEYIMALRQKRKCCLPLHSRAMSSELSPENTAIIVALELARVFDASNPSVEHVERISSWLDQHGLYPLRQVYRRTDINNNISHNNDKGSVTSITTFNNQDKNVSQQSFTCKSGDPFDKNNTTRVSLKEIGEEQTEKRSNDDMSWANPLTTNDSPFADSMQLILLSPCANALLHMFASAFSIPVLELADMAVRSGIYSGPTRFFATLRQAAESGDYSLMPLSRRLSPIKSVWTSVYFALHSEDRLPFLAALQHIKAATTREKEISMARIIQRILRKHQASRLYQFNYSIRLNDESDGQHFKGIYFLSYVSKRFAIYSSVRSARKTVTFDSETGKITLCAIGAKEQQVESLDVQFNGPIVVNIETESAKCVIDCVRQLLGAEDWQVTVRHLNRCGRVRRRMRVPMLASRLDALASVREATAMASHPIASVSTLLGWGETEVLITTLPPVHSPLSVGTMRYELQQNLLSLAKPSLVFGISENRVIAMYASLVALLEYIEKRVLRQSTSAQQHSPRLSVPRCKSSLTWVDVLLCDEKLGSKMTPVCTRLRSGELPPADAGSDNCMPGSPMQLPSSTASLKREQTQHAHQNHTATRQTPQRSRDVKSFPTYQEVMLGLDCCSNLCRNGSRCLSSGRAFRDPQQRDRHHRRVCSQHRGFVDAADGAGNTIQTRLSSVNCSSFNLFTAEECRKRLYRLLHFIAVYKSQQSNVEKSSDTLGTVATKTVHAEMNGNASVGERFTVLRKEQHSPRMSHHHPKEHGQQQQQLSQLSAFQREKTFLRNGVSSIKKGSNSPLMGKTNVSPVIEAVQQQRQHNNYHHHHHCANSNAGSDNTTNRRIFHSRSLSEEHEEENEHRGRSPINGVVISSALERSPRRKRRSRVQSNGRRRTDTKDECGCLNDMDVTTPSSSSSSIFSERLSSASESLSSGDDNARVIKRRRRRM